jgi:hypothetical protein
MVATLPQFDQVPAKTPRAERSTFLTLPMDTQGTGYDEIWVQNRSNKLAI